MKAFIKHHYAFHRFSDGWNEMKKWLYVIFYVTFFNIGLIPILSVSKKNGLLVEGSFRSLGILILIFLLWFAIYQPIVNFFVTRYRKLSL